MQKENKKSIELSPEEKKAIRKRMNEIKKDNKAPSTQNTVPFLMMYKDGLCQVTDNYFSRTVQFYDINYQLAPLEEKSDIFSKYCDLLNYFDDSIHFQLTFENQTQDVDKLAAEIVVPEQEDDFNDVRQEYSAMLKTKITEGNNGKVLKKYITYGLEADAVKVAKSKLDSITSYIIKMLKAIGVSATAMTGKDRLEAMYHSLNPYITDKFVFDWKYLIKSGWTPKDYIAPASMKFSKADFELSECCGAVSTINIMAGELSDRILNDFMELQHLFCITIHAQPFDQVSALKFIKLKLSDVEKMKIDEQKKATRAGYDPDILPPSIKLYIQELEGMLEDLNAKNERLFHITLTIRNYSHSKKKLKLQIDTIKRVCQKNNCKLMPLDYMQEQALGSSLPLGINNIPIKRELTTSAIAVWVPFTTQEIFQGGNATYYGVNALSNNMILADRKNLKNPNGLILGTPGSGKSFTVKREILDAFLKSTDDIYICDPEGEYYPLVQHLQGQLIRIATNSEQHINPMDINLTADYDENPISMKSDFLISLLELVVGGKYGLTAEERSVIDKCVRNIYTKFLSSDPTQDKMPILEDLWDELCDQGEIASRVATSLDMYVHGSQNIFNNRTNIDMNNRLICFDIKELGNQLRKVGMLIVQDSVWNAVSKNRAERKSTRYYIDEFHLLLKEEQTAKYSVEIWKRFRKWGGIPTGITQNVKDLLQSQEVENIFDNSDFVIMLNQAAGDREILAEKLHISDQQLEHVTNCGQGAGLLFFGDVILPFKDTFPTDTTMYRLMTTKPEEQLLTTAN